MQTGGGDDLLPHPPPTAPLALTCCSKCFSNCSWVAPPSAVTWLTALTVLMALMLTVLLTALMVV